MYQNDNQKNHKKEKIPHNNYYEAMKKNYNQKGNNDGYNNIDDKFEKTKNKVKVIMYKNGFILNNGPFRDKSIPENRKFMEEVEKGLIPEEIMKKGIIDLGILLENRKNEVFSKKQKNPITATLEAYINGNQNDLKNINQNNNLNDFNYIPNNINMDPNLETDITIQPPIILKPGEEIPDIYELPETYITNQQTQNKHQQENKQNRNNKFNYIGKGRRQNSYANNMRRNPIGFAEINNRKKGFLDKNENGKNNNINIEDNFAFKKRESISAPKKKEEKRIRTFASLIREEKEKEEEEKMKKKKGKIGEKVEEKKEEEKEKKFQAFTGEGQIIGNINTKGLHVNKDIKNVVDRSKPISTFSIRLFNGEIVKCEFNHNQVLRDIYYYVQNISGSRNFHLLDGFPPKPLRDYNRPIGELKLDNTILTQKIK